MSSSIAIPPTPSTSRRSHGKKKDRDSIPRPPNAFFLFKKHWKSEKHIPSESEPRENIICQIAGGVWRGMSDQEKAPWYKQYDELVRAHAAAYPKYKYQPVRSKEPVRRRRQARTAEEEARHCEELRVKFSLADKPFHAPPIRPRKRTSRAKPTPASHASTEAGPSQYPTSNDGQSRLAASLDDVSLLMPSDEPIFSDPLVRPSIPSLTLKAPLPQGQLDPIGLEPGYGQQYHMPCVGDFPAPIFPSHLDPYPYLDDDMTELDREWVQEACPLLSGPLPAVESILPQSQEHLMLPPVMNTAQVIHDMYQQEVRDGTLRVSEFVDPRDMFDKSPFFFTPGPPHGVLSQHDMHNNSLPDHLSGQIFDGFPIPDDLPIIPGSAGETELLELSEMLGTLSPATVLSTTYFPLPVDIPIPDQTCPVHNSEWTKPQNPVPLVDFDLSFTNINSLSGNFDPENPSGLFGDAGADLNMSAQDWSRESHDESLELFDI